MTDYFIIRTRHGKEAVVEAAIRHMGFTAWTPAEVRPFRTAAMRKTGTTGAVERPAIPKTLFAAIPEALHGDLYQIRDFVRVECDVACTALKIPANHIETFFETLEAWNARERHRITSGNRGRPEKKRWQKLEPQTMAAVLEQMFGISEAA